MSSAKTGNKENRSASEPRTSNDAEVRLAYEIHTLAQLVYGELVTAPHLQRETHGPMGAMGPMGPMGTAVEFGAPAPGSPTLPNVPFGWPAAVKTNEPYWSVPSHWPL